MVPFNMDDSLQMKWKPLSSFISTLISKLNAKRAQFYFMYVFQNIGHWGSIYLDSGLQQKSKQESDLIKFNFDGFQKRSVWK